MTDNQDITPEDYKAQVFKRRMVELIIQYEDTIAAQATRIAQLESENLRQKDAQIVASQNTEEEDNG